MKKKFRVWDKTFKSFDYIDFEKGLKSLSGNSYLVNDRDCIFQQFAGLKSKSAQDVYEGDIVKVSAFGDLFGIEDKVILRVGWSEIECGWRGFAYLESPDKKSSGSKITECEVIGNVFENADLLK